MCAPCNHQCHQGRACPTRLREPAQHPVQPARKEFTETVARLRECYLRLRQAAHI